jgi:hypothetical protein
MLKQEPLFVVEDWMPTILKKDAQIGSAVELDSESP